MSTDETNEQEAPGVRTAKTDDEDTEGHVRTAMSDDAEGGAGQPSVRTGVRTAANDEQDDTEGHVHTAMSGGDPDFGAQQPSVHTAAKDDEDDTEGHVKAGGH
jgi:hypothetical protein